MGFYLFLFKTEYPNVICVFFVFFCCLVVFFPMGHSSTFSLWSLSEIDKTEEIVDEMDMLVQVSFIKV